MANVDYEPFPATKPPGGTIVVSDKTNCGAGLRLPTDAAAARA
ncbi:hypothetical protein [Phytoactinopolyspora mesophila]|nr:hypothetical protein [Phytoactinopolyspora mesophila]